MWLPVRVGKRDEKKHQRLLWTPGFPMKTFIYTKERQNRAIVEEEKTIFEYIYVYVKLGK